MLDQRLSKALPRSGALASTRVEMACARENISDYNSLLKFWKATVNDLSDLALDDHAGKYCIAGLRNSQRRLCTLGCVQGRATPTVMPLVGCAGGGCRRRIVHKRDLSHFSHGHLNPTTTSSTSASASCSSSIWSTRNLHRGGGGSADSKASRDRDGDGRGRQDIVKHLACADGDHGDPSRHIQGAQACSHSCRSSGQRAHSKRIASRRLSSSCTTSSTERIHLTGAPASTE
mgnify:CR=1 FL=1